MIRAACDRVIDCAFGLLAVIALELAAQGRAARRAERAAKHCAECPAAPPRDPVAKEAAEQAADHRSCGLLVAIGGTAENAETAAALQSAGIRRNGRGGALRRRFNGNSGRGGKEESCHS